jgi:hypothetical protein
VCGRQVSNFDRWVSGVASTTVSTWQRETKEHEKDRGNAIAGRKEMDSRGQQKR